LLNLKFYFLKIVDFYAVFCGFVTKMFKELPDKINFSELEKDIKLLESE